MYRGDGRPSQFPRSDGNERASEHPYANGNAIIHGRTNTDSNRYRAPSSEQPHGYCYCCFCCYCHKHLISTAHSDSYCHTEH